ncbi:MAG: rod shape-determining protein MreC [Myxococcales bacterium]|nr:rod shape-determining protein MreC [Myxococcales bacterium]
MREFLLKIRLPALFAFLVTLTLVSMVKDRAPSGEESEDRSWFRGVLFEIAVPIQKALTSPVRATTDAWRRYVALVELGAENERLRQRIGVLQEEVLQYREALVASGHLQRIVEMREDFDIPLLPSEIVGQDVSPWFRSVLLQRGSAGEVRSGMPVVADSGLVGIVTATSPRTGRVMLLLDRQSAVSGIAQRSRARGIVRGLGTGELEFVLMVRGDDVEAGDVIVTSGLDGAYPKGLRIGTVEKVQRADDQLVHTAEVKPAVDFGRLEQVFVMKRRGPTMQLLYEGEGDLASELSRTERLSNVP